jgi:hypothetical protein
MGNLLHFTIIRIPYLRLFITYSEKAFDRLTPQGLIGNKIEISIPCSPVVVDDIRFR